MVLKSVGVMPCAKLFGVLYAIMGLIFGAFVSLFSVLGAMGGADSSALFGVGAIVFLPLFYGILGFIGGALMTALYNLVAKYVGGLELELEPRHSAVL